MKVYSDKLTSQDLAQNAPEFTYVEFLSIRQPRVRTRGWTVSLNSTRDAGRNKNSGTHGAATWLPKAASYDEHGEWMAQLFEIDPEARIAIYDGVEDFHRQTAGKYRAIDRKMVTRDQRRDMSEAHAEGLHAEIPREFCPDCE